MTREPLSDLELARAAAAGDADAWCRIVDELGPSVYAIALGFVRLPSLAEELAQDTFVKLFENLDKYPGGVPLKAWTQRVARNLCIDHYRHRRSETSSVFLPADFLDTLAAGEDPALLAEHRQLLRHVAEALAGLDEDVALLLRLRDIQGLAYAEIATLLDLPTGTVKSRIHRGRRELLRRLRARWSRAAPASAGEDGAENYLWGAAPC